MTFDTLRAAIDDRSARIAVIGCGYVGLPLAMAFAETGYRVTGVDTDESKVRALQRGESHVLDVPAEQIRAQLAADRFCATSDFDTLRSADIVFVAVPTPFDRAKQPDLSYIVSAAESVQPRLRPGQLIILESTTYPGTTDEILRPILERSGLRAGDGFYLAFSPERIDPGNLRFRISNTPKVVGGVDPKSTELAVRVLRQVIKDGAVHPVSSARAAELTKLLENTYRAVNIALVNELAMLCHRMGIDIWEVIEAAATKPYGFMPFYPGPGVGGHCLVSGEWVYARRSGAVIAETVDELWERSAAGRTVERIGDVEVIRAPAVDGLGIGVDGPAAWEEVSHLFRRRYAGALVTVRTADGRTVTTTEGHPFLVVSYAGVTIRAARDLVPGDLLPLYLADPTAERGTDPLLNIIPFLSPDQRRRTRTRIRGDRWSSHRELLRSRLGSAASHDFVRGDYVPLDVYIRLEADGAPVPPRERIVLWTGRGRSTAAFPAVVSLTPDLARLVGYYATEGCITEERGGSRVRFTFHPDETEVIADLVAILERLGVRHSRSRDRVWNAVHVRAASSLFAVFLRDALGCGVDSYDAAVAGVLLAASEAHRRELLSGLLRGDGSVDARSGPRNYRKRGREYRHESATATIGFWTSSSRLERQMSFLLQSLGLRARLRRRTTQEGVEFRLLGAETGRQVAPLFADAKLRRLVRTFARKQRWPSTHRAISVAGQPVTAVGSITRREAETTVYSIETASTHTFATGHGVFLHNCIPVDPYYLAWKAREFDFHTKFIELAAETNLAMPFFTVGRVRRMLDNAGVPLRGARILALGAAFKRDIDDARNSAAVRVMEILRAEGAEVEYHDPFVPELLLASDMFGRDGERALLKGVPLDAERIARAQCVVILVGHSTVDYDLVLAKARLVFDAVNATKGRSGRAAVERL